MVFIVKTHFSSSHPCTSEQRGHLLNPKNSSVPRLCGKVRIANGLYKLQLLCPGNLHSLKSDPILQACLQRLPLLTGAEHPLLGRCQTSVPGELMFGP